MASIGSDPGGRKRIIFYLDDTRKAIYLGKLDKSSAQAIANHIDALVSSKVTGQPLRGETGLWLANIGSKLKEKISNAGLIQKTGGAITLAEFLESYFENRPEVKPASKVVWQHTARNLYSLFGPKRQLASITPSDAIAFKTYLTTLKPRNPKVKKLAPTTQAKRLEFCNQFFNAAVNQELITRNPFHKIRVPGSNYGKEKLFIRREWVEKILAVADPAWKGIISLARYGGLRTPSETLSLEWNHIHWDTGRITVPCVKTSNHPGKAYREIPLFPELVEPLLDLFEIAPKDSRYVIPGNYLAKANTPKGWCTVNLRTQFNRLCKRAGIALWKSPFHSMRASRVTELSEAFPMKSVAAWMGHDISVALRNYAQVPDEHFERASKVEKKEEEIRHKRGRKSGLRDNTELLQSDENASKPLPQPLDNFHLNALPHLTQPIDTKGLKAEEGGFEPPIPLQVFRFSRPHKKISCGFTHCQTQES